MSKFEESGLSSYAEMVNVFQAWMHLQLICLRSQIHLFDTSVDSGDNLEACFSMIISFPN